ncbi:MAG TPA: hypothetical protein PLC65_20915, partial [Bacteroidia bacterium]|nr:hypothetical protein [Bacteroidia bacterium]
MLALFFVLSFNLVFSQVNNVGNPSFEIFHSGCNAPNFVTKLQYWGSLDTNNAFGPGFTYNTCYMNIPNGGPGLYQMPKSGNGLIRTTFFCSTVTCSQYNSREYPKNRMLSNLISGK